MSVSFWMIWGDRWSHIAGHSYQSRFSSRARQFDENSSRNCWSGPCWRKLDKSCVGKVTGLIFSQNYRNCPIYGTMETMFIEGFHWNMHGICLATLLLTMQFHNQCQAYYTSVILQQHECGTWRKLLIKVAMWPQTQMVQPNFETDEVSHRHGTLRKSHGLIKTRLTPVYQAPMPRFECELSHFGFKLLETPFCIILLITHLSWWLVAMPLCLCAWKDHGLKNCNAFTLCPPCLGTIRFVGRYQWSKLFFFRDCALAFLLSKRLQEA